MTLTDIQLATIGEKKIFQKTFLGSGDRNDSNAISFEENFS